jgi:hypothetical protein
MPARSSKARNLEAAPRQSDTSRIASLISRGLAVANRLDKDNVLEELYQVWGTENRHLESYLRKNRQKQFEVDSSLSKFERLRTEMEEVDRRSSFYRTFQHCENKKSVQLMLQEVINIEALLVQNPDVEDRHLISDIQSSTESDDVRRIQLVDLTARRLEDYIYLLRKRAVAIEQGEFTAFSMRSQYRTVCDLIHAYDVRLAENEALRSDESQHRPDAVTKRRKLAKCSREVSANMSLLLQRHLFTNYSMLDWLHPTKHLSPREQPFDDVAKDAMFQLTASQFTKNDFELLSSEEVTNQIINGDEPAKLEALRSLYIDLEAAFEHLMDDLSRLREVRRLPAGDAIITEMDRLWRLNDQLFEAIAVENQIINQGIIQEHKFYDQISRVIEEHRAYDRQWVINYGLLTDLLKSHIAIRLTHNQNDRIIQTLHHLSQAWARPRHATGVVRDYLHRLFILPCIGPSVPELPSMAAVPPGLSSQPEPLTMNFMTLLERRRQAARRKKVSKRRRDTESFHDGDTESVASLASDQPAAAKLSPDELFVLSAYTISVADWRLAQHHKIVRTIFDVASSTINKSTEEAVEKYRVEITANLRLLRGAYRELLRIPTAVVETQTGPLPFVDIETMTTTGNSRQQHPSLTKRTAFKT